ncbi:hypothetical protein [Pelistega europaea]|nr:hypothetical protein [Pelistega europaea]
MFALWNLDILLEFSKDKVLDDAILCEVSGYVFTTGKRNICG